MAQTSYGSITITETTDIKTFVRYSENSDGRNYVATPTSTTKYIGVYVGPDGTETNPPAYNNSGWKWSKYQGNGIGSVETKFINWATNTEGNKPTTSAAWQTAPPAYDASKPYYYVWTRITYSDASPTDNIYLDAGVSEAIVKSAQALSVATNVVEDAQGAIAIARAQEQHFWFNAADIGSGVNLIESGAYITDTAIDTFKSGKSGGYLLARSDKVEMGKASAKYAVLDATSLKFYTPGTTYKGIEVGTNGITIYRGWDATEQENLKGIEITSSGIDVFGGLSNVNKKVASFGETVVLGQNENNYIRTEISFGNFSLIRKDNQGQDTQIFVLHVSDNNGSALSVNPYLTFGDRNLSPAPTTYDDTSTYTVGQTCIYYNEEYICKEQIDTPEAFHASKWKKVTGYYSSAFGINNIAAGIHSYAEGLTSKAIGDYSHAEGYYSMAVGDYSHAEGQGTSNGNYSHAEGQGTSAIGICSHAEGRGNSASGDYSHTEGYVTSASGNYSHAEGYGSSASGDYSHAEGYQTQASGNYSHAMGNNTIAAGNYQTVMGQYNVSNNSAPFIIGNGSSDSNRSNLFTINSAGDLQVSSNFWIINKADSKNYLKISSNALEFFMNVDNISTSVASFGETIRIGAIVNEASRIEMSPVGFDLIRRLSNNRDNIIAHFGYDYTTGPSSSTGYPYPFSTLGTRNSNYDIGGYSCVLGTNLAASGYGALAEGLNTMASGEGSHAEGFGTGMPSYADYLTIASGDGSHAEGRGSLASGNYSHAEGVTYGYGTAKVVTVASGAGSHAENQGTIAAGDYTHTSGIRTLANYKAQFVIGAFNDNKSTNVFEVGWGSDDSTRKNIFEIDKSGNVNIPSGAEYQINGSPHTHTTLTHSSISIQTTSYTSVTIGANGYKAGEVACPTVTNFAPRCIVGWNWNNQTSSQSGETIPFFNRVYVDQTEKKVRFTARNCTGSQITTSARFFILYTRNS